MTLPVLGAGPSSIAAAGDWWDPNGDGLCVWAAYAAKGAASLAASYTDLSGNGNDCAPGIAPAWDIINGWKFDGFNDWLDTGVTDTDGTWTAIAQFTNATNLGTFFGKGNPLQNGDFYFQRTAGSINYFHHNANNQAPIMAAGNLCIAGPNCYRDGAPDGVSGGFGASLAGTIPIGAMRLLFPVPSITNFCAVYMQAFALYFCTLTAPQVSAVATAMVAL